MLRRILTKSDHLPARLLCAGVSALRSTQPSQAEVFPCSVCVDAQVFPCPGSQCAREPSGRGHLGKCDGLPPPWV